jgi:hypothetical protein
MRLVMFDRTDLEFLVCLKSGERVGLRHTVTACSPIGSRTPVVRSSGLDTER